MLLLKRSESKPETTDYRILTAALELFASNGYCNVSVHDIRKLAGVSVGSIYNHFVNKEGVARGLYNQILNEMDQFVDDISSELDSPSAQCEEIIKQLFILTETHHNVMAFVFHAKHTEFIPDEPLICNSSPFIKIRNIIYNGIKTGEFIDIDLWVAASTVFGGAIRMIQLRLDGLIEKPLTNYHELIINTAWSGIKKESASFHKKTSMGSVSSKSY